VLGFAGWWLGMSGLMGMVAVCPCCGQPGCPAGVVGMGFLGAVGASVMRARAGLRGMLAARGSSGSKVIPAELTRNGG
jgi:hypothetical protein